jgi:hypothetical protein
MHLLTNDRIGHCEQRLSPAPVVTECQEKTGSPIVAPSPAQREPAPQNMGNENGVNA